MPLANTLSMQEKTKSKPEQLGPLLLDIGIMLIQAGASSHRINTVINRIASAYDCTPDIHIDPKSISLSLQLSEAEKSFNGARNATGYGVNFATLSGLSTMSLSLVKKQWQLQEIRTEMKRLSSLPHYPRILVLTGVALAGACFCYTFGGDLLEMAITFGATFCGLWAKQELVKRSVNTYICSFLSALVACLFTGAFYKFGMGLELEHAYATCVLFLIPGVPLINFFIDLLAGNILFGLDRGLNALLHIMAIAFALAIAIVIYNFPR